MDIKNKIVLAVQTAEHLLELHITPEMPLGIIHDGLVTILQDIVKRINDSAPKPAPTAEASPVPEAAPVVEAPTPQV